MDEDAQKSAEKNFPIKHVGFEEGGPKGFIYIGVCEILQEYGYLSSIETAAGISAGAIAALFLALGYNVNEAKTIMVETNFNAFKDSHSNLIHYYGIHSGKTLYEWIVNIITQKKNNPNLTFRDLNQLIQNQGINNNENKFRDLTIIGTNLSEQKKEIYNFGHTPDMKIAEAIRISMSLPVFFSPFQKDGKIYVDGGVGNYNLTEFFDAHYPYSESLVFKSSSHHQDYSVFLKSGPVAQIKNISDYLMALLSMEYKKNALKIKRDPRRVSIDASHVSSFNFNLSRENKIYLINQGKKYTAAYFQQYRLNSFSGPISRPVYFIPAPTELGIFKNFPSEKVSLLSHHSLSHYSTEKLLENFILSCNNPDTLFNFIKACSVDISSYKNSEGNTFLHLSAAAQNTTLLKVFLKININLNAVNHAGDTVLMIAVSLANIDIIKILFNKNLNAQLDINYYNSITKKTALMIAVEKGCYIIVKILLKNQANPQIKNSRDETALILAQKLPKSNSDKNKIIEKLQIHEKKHSKTLY